MTRTGGSERAAAGHDVAHDTSAATPGGAIRAKSGSPGYDHLAPLFARMARLDPDDPERSALREHLVAEHLPLAQNIARRFSHRGEPQDDLEQVATVGLIHAVDRYDPERGNDFLSFAIPTITGEVRRHFRDHAWAVRVPRRLKELHVAIGSAMSELSQRYGRAPTASELATHLGVPREQVLEGLEAAGAYRSRSLDSMLDTEGPGGPLEEVVGISDAELDRVEFRTSLGPALQNLPEREQVILKLRFFAGMTQSQIAQRVGLSQMHISRLLARTLDRLREELHGDG